MRWRSWGRVTLVVGCLVLAVLSALEGNFALAIGGSGAFMIGTFLACRVPGNRVALAMQVGGGSGVLADWSDAFAGLSAVGRVAAVVALSVFPLIAVGFNSLLLVFPTGRALAGWRWLLRALVVIGVFGAVLGAAWALTLSPAERVTAVATSDDAGNPAEPLSAVLFMTLPVSLVAAGVRYRRSTGSERLQMRWLVLGAAVFFAVAILQNAVLDFDSTFAVAGTTLGFLLYPLAVAIAVLRHRLFDIDRIISRTVAYSIVALLIASLYGLVALGPVLVLGEGQDTPPWLVAAATLLAFAAFSPLRRRVQRVVDRRFDRARYDAQVVVDGVGSRLRDATDLGAVTGMLSHAASEVFRPASVGVWMRTAAALGDGGSR